MTKESESYRRRMLLGGVPQGADALRRIVIALAGLVGVTAIGTFGYMLIADLTFVDALYQTVFTVATVGYTELFERTVATELFTTVLIVLGVGTVLYNLGVLAEAFTEGHVRQHLWRRKMDRTIAAYRGHIIVCGFGRVGRSAIEHLLDTGHQVVIVEKDADRLVGVDLPFVLGDASADDVLRDAGITNARALICALDSDAETTYATLSARALCPDLVIISRARTVDSKDKLVLAGATRAVNPQLIGGRRMASFALHADVAEFLDEVMHDDDAEHRIQQVRVVERSAFVGRTTGQLDVPGRFGTQLLAVRAPRKGAFIAAPAEDTVIEVGSTLIVFGTPEQVLRLRQEANGQ
ncbi:potassium channel family protein [Nostocoides sp.]|uniref:potassium channel family protein n=1 Tax=Nostocoides sp. TaxID=1917966 RepID=UPI003BAF2AE4